MRRIGKSIVGVPESVSPPRKPEAGEDFEVNDLAGLFLFLQPGPQVC